MKLIRGINGINQFSEQSSSLGKSVVCTLGNFDGVHIGHQALIMRLKQMAQQYKLPTLCIFFEPHADEFFNGSNAKCRLMHFRQKLNEFSKLGLDYCCMLKFDEAFRVMPAATFLANLKKLNPKYILTGGDFRFGSNRSGDNNDLNQWAEQHDIKFEIAKTVEIDNERVSSTRIRNLIKNSNFIATEKLLGKKWSFENRVIHGKSLGKTIGFPTANLALHRHIFPVKGVFAGIATVGDKSFHAVANIGTRPTFTSLGKPLMEVHLIDQDINLYAKRLNFHFIEKLRDEKKFPSLDALKQQIKQDVNQAIQILNLHTYR